MSTRAARSPRARANGGGADDADHVSPLASVVSALKRAGAGRVAVIVLGRHLDPADRLGAPLAARLAPGPCDPGRCAVHRVSAH